MRQMNSMDKPNYLERQEMKLCGKHCLNNLFQREVFTQEDLNAIAIKLDEDEAELAKDFSLKCAKNYDEKGNYWKYYKLLIPTSAGV